MQVRNSFGPLFGPNWPNSGPNKFFLKIRLRHFVTLTKRSLFAKKKEKSYDGKYENFMDGRDLASFADDTRIWMGISGVNDASALQRDLEIIYQWAEDNNIFNDLKFENLR